ncbi:MAG: hypothetical protein HQM16_06475 [Deltaproteobacteria bacterium]|nr:hypothetical protein [Deltaproteobacteria bacterium]
MKYLLMGFLALSLLMSAPAVANQPCSCTEQCQKDCAEGKTKDCPCKNCECSKGEGCKHKQAEKNKK